MAFAGAFPFSNILVLLMDAKDRDIVLTAQAEDRDLHENFRSGLVLALSRCEVHVLKTWRVLQITRHLLIGGARGGAVGWGTAPQVGKVAGSIPDGVTGICL